MFSEFLVNVGSPSIHIMHKVIDCSLSSATVEGPRFEYHPMASKKVTSDLDSFYGFPGFSGFLDLLTTR